MTEVALPRKYARRRLSRTQGLLELLARHTESQVRLLSEDDLTDPDVSGVAAHRGNCPSRPTISAALAKGTKSVIFECGKHVEYAFRVEAPSGVGGALHMVAPYHLPASSWELAADIAHLLSNSWQWDLAEATQSRAAEPSVAAARSVVRLLLTHKTAAAREVAEDQDIVLPDPVVVCVVDHPGTRATTVVAQAGGALIAAGAWSAPCPSHEEQTIVLVSGRRTEAAETVGGAADEGQDPRTHDIIALLRECFPTCSVGVSQPHALTRVAMARRQALTALAVARHNPSGSAQFGGRLDPVALLVHEGAEWTRELLAPLTMYRPTRRSQPSGSDLLVTLGAWLHAPHRAPDDLHVHRNTLMARRRLIHELLGLDLERFDNRVAVSLALRISAGSQISPPPRAAGSDSRQLPRTLDELTALPHVHAWGRLRLRRLRLLPEEQGIVTLGTWLANEARFAPTAESLGISVPGARKRLARIEDVLGLPLVHTPAHQYDLWLAFRALGKL